MILWQFLPLSLLFTFIMVYLCVLNKISLLGDYFIMDSFGMVLSIIPMFMIFSMGGIMMLENKKFNVLLMIVSCVSSCLCFKMSKFMLFFLMYELSIISLLFSLFMKSPYSERSMAGWYFLGYLVFGGMPLLVLCVYFSLDFNSMTVFNLKDMVSYGLFVIFITKVPLFPFHAWLPMVHAEANSFMSMMLSGYMMKLGLLGMLRFFTLSCDDLKFYLFVFFTVSCFFFMSCFCELDKKRWLAFLSLGHISMGMGGIFSLNLLSNDMLSSFSLGHGLSVFMLFFYFYCYSLESGSRNWVLKTLYKNKMGNLLLMMGMMSLMAFPPCILFFNEMLMFLSMNSVNMLIMVFGLYLFLSVLGPVGCTSLMMSRIKSNLICSINNCSFVVVLCSMLVFFFMSVFL